jgi:mannose-1-phosphate guanylyltransferase
MEKSERVFVVPSEFSWSDLGTWGSVYEKLEKDEHANASSSEVLFQNTRGSLVVDSEGKQIVLESVEDLILINTPKAILVCHRDAEQNIKQIVARLSAD